MKRVRAVRVGQQVVTVVFFGLGENAVCSTLYRVVVVV